MWKVIHKNFHPLNFHHFEILNPKILILVLDFWLDSFLSLIEDRIYAIKSKYYGVSKAVNFAKVKRPKNEIKIRIKCLGTLWKLNLLFCLVLCLLSRSYAYYAINSHLSLEILDKKFPLWDRMLVFIRLLTSFRLPGARILIRLFARIRLEFVKKTSVFLTLKSWR